MPQASRHGIAAVFGRRRSREVRTAAVKWTAQLGVRIGSVWVGARRELVDVELAIAVSVHAIGA